MRSRSAALVLFAALALAALLSSCRSVPATQVLVFFHADAATAAEAATIRVRVTSDEGDVVVDREDPLAPAVGYLARVPVIPEGRDASRSFRIEGALLDREGAVTIEVSALSGYVASRRLELHLWFDPECAGITCGAGRTCQRGFCAGDCFDALEGGARRSEPRCSECEVCSGGTCTAREDGAECGCPGDSCTSGRCSTARPVREVLAGHLHTCAVLEGSEIYCWGSDRVGMTTVGSTDVPARVSGVGGSEGTAATDHTCIIDFKGERACFGWNGHGQLGDGSIANEVAGPVYGAEPALKAIDSGWFHSCGISDDNRVYCWGGNRSGELGEPVGEPVPSPREMAPGERFLQIASGGFHDCALRMDGRLFCWGLNASGELGTGDFVDRSAPSESGCLGGVCLGGWELVGAGDFHTCALRDAGDLYCWGGAASGQLGAGPTLLANSAQPLGPLEGGPYVIVGGGGAHTCAITASGELACWGRNDSGQLGVGSTEQVTRPARVALPGDATILELDLGREHTCVIRSDHTLWCWGRNLESQLGLGLSGGGPDIVTAPRRVCF